jgi:hypothetical protein
MVTLRDFAPISVEQLVDEADLQRRVDRKYQVGSADLQRVFEAVANSAHWGVLTVDDEVQFGYRSYYFDTRQRDSLRSAAQRHRRRFKVRVREYVDRNTFMVEVKTKGPHGETLKHRAPCEGDDRWALSAAACSFVADTLSAAHVRVDVDALVPAVATSYERATLIDLTADRPARATIDVAFAWRRLAADAHHAQPDVSNLAGWQPTNVGVIVETKTLGGRCGFDEALWRQALRPRPISKFALACLLDDPTLTHGRWHRAVTHRSDGPAMADAVAPR